SGAGSDLDQARPGRLRGERRAETAVLQRNAAARGESLKRRRLVLDPYERVRVGRRARIRAQRDAGSADRLRAGSLVDDAGRAVLVAAVQRDRAGEDVLRSGEI